MDAKKRLSKKLRRVPQKPGAYLMRDEAADVIYVGKAKRLRSRLSSYFGGGRADSKGLSLRKRIADFEYIVTDSEVEALILELHLIKEHRPRYNVNLRDDKKYPYIRVTSGEPFPRVFPTRRVVQDGSRYFGPYTDAKAMRRTLRMLRQLFPVRSCRWDLPRKGPERPCLNFEIKRCMGPCSGTVTSKEYRKMIRDLCSFLSGHRESLVVRLEREMEKLSGHLEFEKAAGARDQLEALKKVTERQKVFSSDGGDRDVIAVSHMESMALGLVLKIRDGRLLSREGYPLRVLAGTPTPEVVGTFLKLYYGSQAEIPREILVPEDPQEAAVIEDWLRQRRGGGVSITRPQRGRKRGLVRLAERNADLLLVEHLASRERGLDEGVEALARALDLDAPPIRIEGFDVSNLGGEETVASLVVFENGRPITRAYRNYRVRTAEACNDFDAMEEVVGRRYRRVTEEQGILPNLILVDGGKGQVSAAAKALGRLKMRIPIVGLAKKEEEVFQEGRASAVPMPKDSAGRRLLMRIRDEAHRVAVRHHRARRQKALRRSDLDRIAGVGPGRKRRLLGRFGSLRALAAAGVEDIRAVPGIGLELANRIHAFFRGDRGP